MSEALYSQLEKSYRRRGYEVYGLFSSSGQLPANWQALPPALLLERRGKRTAIYRLKTAEEIQSHLSSFRRLLADPDTSVRLLVDSRRDKVEVCRYLKAAGLSCELILLRRSGRRRWPRFLGARGGWWKAVFFLALVLFAVLLVWLVTLFYGYSPRYYEPRDLERKVKEWKQK